MNKTYKECIEIINLHNESNDTNYCIQALLKLAFSLSEYQANKNASIFAKPVDIKSELIAEISEVEVVLDELISLLGLNDEYIEYSKVAIARVQAEQLEKNIPDRVSQYSGLYIDRSRV